MSVPTLGIMGGGQLGSLLADAAKKVQGFQAAKALHPQVHWSPRRMDQGL